MRLERADLLQIYYLMRLTRALEDRTRMLFLQGRVVGGVTLHRAMRPRRLEQHGR